MKYDELQYLMDLARRRPLKPDERDRLIGFMEANPDTWPGWEEDMALTRLLNRLPDAPLASNFSSRVMQAIAVEARQAERKPGPWRWLGWLRGWPARVGFASCVALLALAGFQRHRLGEPSDLAEIDRADLAESVATISEVVAIPSVEILKDFETIQSFSRVPAAADMEADLRLLAALE